jgi:hypothetical protein
MRFPGLSSVLALLAPSLLGLLGPASSAGAAEKPAASAESVRYVNISPIAAPVVFNGRLINYVFISVRLNAGPAADISTLRDKEPYFRDALVRAAHRRPLVKPGDYTHLDEPRLKSVMMAEAARIAGPNMITSVDILDAQPMKTSRLSLPSAGSDGRAPIP